MLNYINSVKFLYTFSIYNLNPSKLLKAYVFLNNNKNENSFTLVRSVVTVFLHSSWVKWCLLHYFVNAGTNAKIELLTPSDLLVIIVNIRKHI